MTAPAFARTRRSRRIWRVALAAGVLVAVVAWADPAQVGAVLRQADPGWLLIGLLSSTLANLASAWRWRDLAAWLGHVAPLQWAIAVYFRAVAANVVLPGAVVGGDALRAWGLHRRGMPVLEAGISVLLDRLSGLWGLLVLGALVLGVGLGSGAMPTWHRFANTLGWISVDILVMTALVASAMMAVLPYGALRATPWLARRMAMLHHPAMRWWQHLAQQDPARHCWRQMGGSLLVQAASVTTLYCGAQAVGAPLPWGALAVAAVPIFLFATLPLGFGGWGTREAAAMAALGLLGLDAPSAVAVSVLYGLYPVAQSVLALLPAGAPKANVASGGNG